MHVSRTRVLVSCTLVILLAATSISAYPLFLPFIEAEFGWPRSMVTLPYVLAMVVWGIGSPLFGKLADDHGARPVMLIGIVLMATGFLAMGLAQELWHLLVAFGVLVGTAMASASVTIAALLISKHYDPSNRARAVSVTQIAGPLNPVLFAPLLFVLITTFDWRTAALVTSASLWALALPLAWVGVRDPDVSKSGALPRLGWSAALPKVRSRTMVLLFIARFACGLTFFQSLHMVTFAVSKGFTAGTGATAVSVVGATAVASALLFGWLADRYGRMRMLSLSYALRGVGTVLVALIAPSELLFLVLVALAVGPTFATIGVQNVVFFELAGPRLAGLVLGLSFIIHQLGAATGAQLGSMIFDATRTYDGFQLAIGLALLFSAAITFGLKDISKDRGRGADSRVPEPRLRPAPSGA